MNCVILGPTKYEKIQKFGKIKDLQKYINKAATFFAKNFDEILIVPDMGLSLLIAQEYKRLNSKGKVIGYIPDKTSNGNVLSKYYKFCDEVKGIDGGWHNLNTELTRNSNNIFCLGFSAGVFIEICSIKYNQEYLKLQTKIFIDKRCISGLLPEEVAIDLKNLIYFNNFNFLVKSKVISI